MAEHIDKTSLNTDLCYRFEYLSKFLNFTLNDITLRNTFAPIVFPVILDNVYRNIFSFDITKQYFLIHNDDFEGYLTEKVLGMHRARVQTGNPGFSHSDSDNYELPSPGSSGSVHA
jgi:hypothetical protein